MKKKTFIPSWYEDKKNEIIYKRTKTCIMIIIIANIILFGFILNISHRADSIQVYNASKNNNIGVLSTDIVDIVTIEKYKELSSFLEVNNLNFKNINISKKSLEIDMEVKSYDEYIIAIRCIENHYSIKELTPSNKNGEKYNFKIIIEV
ncbi:hypothetical protein [Clostridium sp.]|uniref:hypothetical protein n=1 Tax=Clostridium sp. TaxID=1506 RepID=UPI003D6D0DF6